MGQRSGEIEQKQQHINGTESVLLKDCIHQVQALQEKVNTLTQLLTENECNSNPCRNGGTCVDTYNGFICNCPSNWEGATCENDVNECARFAGTSFGCQNGATCINNVGGYSCTCPPNWYGIHCTQQHDDCSTASHQELCGHGTCIDEKRALPGQPRYRCICDPGWQNGRNGPACTEDIDECSGAERRCSLNPPVTCINLPGTFHCGQCPAVFGTLFVDIEGIRSLIRSFLTYVSETWPLTLRVEEALGIFEKKILGSILGGIKMNG
ncbi:cubilin homolog [Trichonephila clavipes]|nr:cubilin homolog [Trichonephila clavipes]